MLMNLFIFMRQQMRRSLRNTSKTLVVAGTLVIWMVKLVVRPYVAIPDFLQPITDIAPNLIGSFLLPFGACWLLPRVFGLRTVKEVKVACLLGLILVVINEFLQLIPVFGRTFDYLDILSSFLGVFLGYASFTRLMHRWSFKTYP